MSGSFNSNLYEAIKQDSQQFVKAVPFKLFGHQLQAMQPDLASFRAAQADTIKDPTNPDEVEAAAADTDGSFYRMMLLCVRDMEGNQVFPDIASIKALPVTQDVTDMILAVTEVAQFDSLLKEETKNSEETQSDE